MIYLMKKYMKCEMSGQEMPQWALVDRNGVPHKLKHSMVFLGRDECDISLQSRSVDKRHAVITFDHYSKKFKIKDLSSLNGTYVNESRIPEQTYVALENLDTIRFGYDPMVFRIEETDGTGEHMSPDRPPAWASKEVSPMAECQGCIVEQDIKHTCGGNPELGDTTDEKHDPVPHTCNGHGTYNRWQMRRRRSHDYATAFTNGVYGNGLRCSKSQEKVYENSYVSTRTSANPSASFHPNYSRSETNLRAMQQRSPVIPYSTGESRTMSGSITPGNESRSRYLYGGLSYTQSVPSLERIAHPGFSITQEIDYGEGKDPVQSDGTSTTFQARLDHRRSLTGEEELATVKKGTPLYGQPSWWGEDDQWSDDKAKTDHNQNSGQGRDKQARDREERVMNGDNNSHHDRPASLPLEQNNNKASNGVKYQTQEKYKHVYMDIPIRDSPTEKSLPPERDKMASTEKVSAEEIVTDKEKLDRSSSSAVAFSVEFSDSEETKSPKISMSESLSKFLPHKVRRSLREKREKKEEREKELREKEQTLKEQEVISPTRQKKLDDLWGSPMEKGKHSKSIRQSTGYTSEGHSQPSDHEQEISIKSDTAVTRGKKPPQQPPGQTRTPGERKPSSRATGGSTKKATAQSQQQSPGVQGSPKQGSGNRDKTKDSAALSASQSSSSSSFLIEKMFESTSRPGARDPRGRDPGGRDPGAEEPTEYALYKEAQSYDTQEGKARSATLPRPRRSPKDSSSQMKKSQSFDQNDLQLQDMDTNSPVGDDNKNDSDSVSEAGTYTIEGDEKSKEEEAISRENIDKVFNVGDSSVILIQRPVIENGVNEKDECQGLDLERQEGEGQVEDLDTLEKEIEELERERANLGVANSMEAEIGSTAQTGKLFSGKPRWVQEWSARKGNSVDSSKETEDDDTFDADSLTAKQPPAVSSRKRIGTGRKLPTPPTPRGSSGEPSPRISGHTSRDGKDISRSEPSTLKRVTANGGSGGMKTSRSEVSEIFASEGRRVTPERTPVERKGRRQQPDYEDSKSTMSIDTEVLLRDTAHVMAAMQARVRKGQQKQSGDEGSDSDSSTHVMVNGANGANRQPASKSAKEHHTPGSKTVSGASPYRGSRQSFPVKTSSPPPSQKPTQSLWRKGPYNPPKGEPPAASVVSDLLSESESRSARSDDASTDISEESPMLSRKTSKGKGAITATRPNRAFQLRRARTETESDTSRSEVSAASSRATSAKTGSAKTNQARPRSATGRSEVSLGAAIVKKSRENNAKQTPTSSQPFSRRDGGRHSLRESTVTSRQKQAEAAKQVAAKVTKTKPGGSGSLSQPNSRSNSPKSAERNAWNRRKSYDPRKAVAEAKIKAKEDKKSQKLIRSSSFNSSKDLEERIVEDSEDEYANFASNIEQEDDDDDFGRSTTESAEITKFSTEIARSLGNLARGLSEDEDHQSAFTSVKDTAEDGAASIFSTGTSRSAFSVPKVTKSPSPLRSPPPLTPAQNRARNTYSRRIEDGVIRRREWDRNESYDSLIVSSIHQLAQKLKISTEKSMTKLRERHQIRGTPSPVDDLLSQPSESDIPAWKTANQELAGILRSLRKVEHHLQVMDKVLFPGTEGSPTTTLLTETEQKQYLQEIERIRSELKGFKPIDSPTSHTLPKTRKSYGANRSKGDLRGKDYW